MVITIDRRMNALTQCIAKTMVIDIEIECNRLRVPREGAGRFQPGVVFSTPVRRLSPRGARAGCPATPFPPDFTRVACWRACGPPTLQEAS
ncbi:hypothetical protein G3N57_15825 [Paraburkholderia sp. Se-20369]|nr:hypothetical protein [Paraburkholderia sp. Se-20369]